MHAEYAVPVVAGGALLAGAGLVLASPMIGGVDGNASAAESEPVAVSVNVPLTLAIKDITSTVSINAENVDQFYTGTTTVKVVTNNVSGYTLSMEDNDDNTALINEDYAGTKIDSITSDITVDATGSNFGANKWGYSIEENKFKPIPVSGSAAQIEKTDGPTDETSSTVTFGTKVNKDLAAGDYQDTVVFSVVANAIVRDITKWNTLQDAAVHPEYCAATETGVTKTVTDSRDGSQYRVRKLNDNHCWMIDDLHLANKTITSSNSDITASSYTVPATIAGTTTSGASNTVAQIHTNTSTYSNSYLYNWMAATAGTGTTSVSSGNASSSICPKGWKLPKGDTSDGSFYYLVNTGGYKTNTALTETDSGKGPEFLYAGAWYDGLYAQGSNGRYWSRTANSSNYAYYLSFGTDGDVGPQSYYGKYYGFAVRCLVASS